jgi:hypothetical protein
MQEGTVFCALGFILETARAVVFVPTLESKASIGSEDRPTGKTTQVIHVIVNFLADFAILARCGRDGLVLCIIELVNSA